jgi:hypothetical protein
MLGKAGKYIKDMYHKQLGCSAENAKKRAAVLEGLETDRIYFSNNPAFPSVSERLHVRIKRVDHGKGYALFAVDVFDRKPVAYMFFEYDGNRVLASDVCYPEPSRQWEEATGILHNSLIDLVTANSLELDFKNYRTSSRAGSSRRLRH